MLTLGINCACRWTNAGLARDGAVIAEDNSELGRKQTERLPLITEELLKHAGASVRDISLIAACTGPGYYTGIRAGIAYAAGLAEALKIKVVPISSLELFAWDLKEKYETLAVFFKANMTHVYGAVYKSEGDSLTPLIPQRFSAEKDFAESLAAYPQAVIITPDLDRYHVLAGLSNIKIERQSASGGACAIMGEKKREFAGLPRTIHGEYLRDPDIGPSQK